MRNPHFRLLAGWRIVMLTAAILALIMGALPKQLPISPIARAANTTVDLSVNGAVDLSIQGAAQDDMTGASIAVGDANGDRIDDLVVGTPGSDRGGRVNRGEVDIFLGKASLRGSLDLASAQPDVRILGADINDYFGTNVGFFDINADNVPDLVMSAPGGDGVNNSRESAGELYVFFGGRALTSAAIDLSTTRPDLLIIGPRVNSQIGSSLAGGNVTGNSNLDLVIGAPLGSLDVGGPATGLVYIVPGQNFAPPFTLDINTRTDVFILLGTNQPGERFGTSVAVGDVNNDTILDVVVGSPSTNGRSSQQGAGLVAVFYGPLTSMSTTFAIFGPGPLSRLGEAVAIGDIDADRISDIIATAPGASANTRSNSGQTYIFYGSAPLTGVRDLAASTADASIAGANPGDQLGGTLNINTGTPNQINSTPPLLVADIDKDGFNDLAIGAPSASNPASRARNGEIFVLLKGGNRFEQRDLQIKPADITILGPRAIEQIATRMALGDINADGKPDLIISAPTSAGNSNRTNSGMVYVVSNFNLNAPGNNQPPTLNPVTAQSVGEGGTITVPVSAIDPDSRVTLSLDRPPTPSFVTLQDNGNGSGTLTIAPPTGSQGTFVVTLRATDNGNPPLSTSLDIALTVTPPMPQINSAVFNGKSLTITGSRFGTGARVLINGADKSKQIKSSSDTSLFVKGKAKKLGLVSGANSVQVVDSTGRASNTVTVNIFAETE